MFMATSPPLLPQELAQLRAEQEDAPPLRELREVAPSESRCGAGCITWYLTVCQPVRFRVAAQQCMEVDSCMEPRFEPTCAYGPGCCRRRDADRLVPLVAEATSEGHSVLVFCSSRKQCESAAALIADLLPQVGQGLQAG